MDFFDLKNRHSVSFNTEPYGPDRDRLSFFQIEKVHINVPLDINVPYCTFLER